jgi:protein O-mannosyl-transferase
MGKRGTGGSPPAGGTGGASSEPSRWERSSWILPLALAILPFLNALGGGFVFDDKSLITLHPAVQAPFSLGKVLAAPLLGDIGKTALWRPLVTLSLALDWRIGGGQPFWFHLVNLLFYAGTVLLWSLLIRRIFRSPLLALIAGCLFAVHPLHTEVATWISGRCDLLAAFFSLAALHLVLAERPWVRSLSLAAIFLALASKESAAVLPILVLYTLWATRGSNAGWSWRLGLSGFLPVLLFLLLRHGITGIWFGEPPEPMDNPLAGIPLISRIPTSLDCAGRYLALLVFPARLSLDYSVPVLGRVQGFTPYLLLGLAGTAGLVALAVRRRSGREGWGAGFAILTFALASNLLLPVATLFAERLLFLPSTGLLLIPAAAGLGLGRLRPKSVRPLAGLFILVLLAFSGRTWARNADYRDEPTLYKAGVAAMPRSYKMRANLAIEYLRSGQNAEALRTGQEALALYPGSRGTRDVIACALDSLGRKEDAIGFLEQCLRSDPQDAGARRRLLFLLSEGGRTDRMKSVAEEGMKQMPDQPEWVGWAARAAQAGRDWPEAARLWREGMERAPQAVDPPLNLAFCLMQQGDKRGAREAYGEALRRAPESAPAANGLAWTLLETGGAPQEAVRWAREAVRLSERAPGGRPQAPYYDTLARACLAAGDCASALEAAERACALDPSDASYQESRQVIRGRCR